VTLLSLRAGQYCRSQDRQGVRGRGRVRPGFSCRTEHFERPDPPLLRALDRPRLATTGRTAGHDRHDS
jgi:hypothetical protein